MKVILDCAICPISVLPIPSVCRLHLLICLEVAAQITLLTCNENTEASRFIEKIPE